MHLPLLLAQAVAPSITQETTISWPVVVTMLAGAAVVIESRVKIARLEKDLEQTQAKGDATALQVATYAALLGEIKEGITELRNELRAQRVRA